MKLFEIDEQIELILAQEDEENEDLRLNPETTAALLESLEMEREQKLLHLARYAKGEEAEAQAVKAQADRLAKRAKTHYNRAKWLRHYIQDHFRPDEKLKDDTVQIGWRRSEGVEVYAPDLLPEECFRITKEPSKTYIKDQIKRGVQLAGAQIVSRLHLLIR